MTPGQEKEIPWHYKNELQELGARLASSLLLHFSPCEKFGRALTAFMLEACFMDYLRNRSASRPDTRSCSCIIHFFLFPKQKFLNI
jgi:hypothetical protein